MRRRAQEAGLQLDISGMAGMGTSVQLTIPCSSHVTGQAVDG